MNFQRENLINDAENRNFRQSFSHFGRFEGSFLTIFW